MSEVTAEQIREFYQQKALIEALERTHAGLKQQLAAETDLAQVMAALSFSADGPLRQGDIPCPSSNKRRGRSTSDENEGSPLPARHCHRNAEGSSSYSKLPTPLSQPTQQERVPRCGGEGGGLGARNCTRTARRSLVPEQRRRAAWLPARRSPQLMSAHVAAAHRARPLHFCR